MSLSLGYGGRGGYDGDRGGYGGGGGYSGGGGGGELCVYQISHVMLTSIFHITSPFLIRYYTGYGGNGGGYEGGGGGYGNGGGKY